MTQAIVPDGFSTGTTGTIQRGHLRSKQASNVPVEANVPVENPIVPDEKIGNFKFSSVNQCHSVSFSLRNPPVLRIFHKLAVWTSVNFFKNFSKKKSDTY